MAEDTANIQDALNNIIIELNKTVKALHFYPKGHPSLVAQLKQTQSAFRATTSFAEELKWTVDQKGFYHGGKAIAPAHAGTEALAKQFFLRRINFMTFTPDISIEDITGFLSLLKMEADNIRSNGGAERVLAKHGVAGVLLNEMSYDELKDLQEELEGQEEEEEFGEPEAEEAAEELPMPEEEPQKEETMEELVALLDKSTDPREYNELSENIYDKIEAAPTDRHFDAAFPVLVVYTKHISPDCELPKKLKEIAFRHFKNLLVENTITELISRIGRREEKRREDIATILLHSGNHGIGLLLDTLVETHEAQSRRNFYNTLESYGEKIRDEVERRLDDERWFALRQMVSLLGALGGNDSLDPLARAYDHPDIRVKKEVLKSLARIPSHKSTVILMSALKDRDRALEGQAIISLGMLKDPDSIYPLGDIAVRKPLFGNKFETRKEAVKALGMIGSKKAVPYLSRVLFKKRLFGKSDNEELRLLAAIALGKIGGEDAIESVEEAIEDSTGPLYTTCKRIVDGSK